MTKSKNNLFLRYMKFWYHIPGPLDEYRKHEMERIGNNAFFGLYNGELLINLIALILWITRGTEAAFLIMLILNIYLMPIGVMIYVSRASKKAGIITNEVEEKDLKQVKHKIIWQGILMGLVWSVFVVVIIIGVDFLQDPHLNLLDELFRAPGPTFFVIYFVLLSVIFIWQKMHRIKVIPNDD